MGAPRAVPKPLAKPKLGRPGKKPALVVGTDGVTAYLQPVPGASSYHMECSQWVPRGRVRVSSGQVSAQHLGTHIIFRVHRLRSKTQYSCTVTAASTRATSPSHMFTFTTQAGKPAHQSSTPQPQKG